MQSKHRPNVGIGVFMFNANGDKFIIGKRTKENLFGLPGGALEAFETFEECAARELFEETALKIDDLSRVKYISCFNCVKKESYYHWVCVYMKINLTSEEETHVKNLEQDKCEGWIWITLKDLLSMWDNLFYPLQTFILSFSIKSIELKI